MDLYLRDRRNNKDVIVKEAVLNDDKEPTLSNSIHIAHTVSLCESVCVCERHVFMCMCACVYSRLFDLEHI